MSASCPRSQLPHLLRAQFLQNPKGGDSDGGESDSEAAAPDAFDPVRELYRTRAQFKLLCSFGKSCPSRPGLQWVPLTLLSSLGDRDRGGAGAAGPEAASSAAEQARIFSPSVAQSF